MPGSTAKRTEAPKGGQRLSVKEKHYKNYESLTAVWASPDEPPDSLSYLLLILWLIRLVIGRPLLLSFSFHLYGRPICSARAVF